VKQLLLAKDPNILALSDRRQASDIASTDNHVERKK
jgi:hypothetical protein